MPAYWRKLLVATDREDIRQLARGQTLTVLARLDSQHKGALVHFLHGAGLIAHDKPILDLIGADLNGANLIGTVLRDSDLSGAHLVGAGFNNAFLKDADLSGANLCDAKIAEDRLEFCESLESTIMPNGQKYEDWIKTKNK